MSHWDYENVGASATPGNKKYIQKIFEYIGFAPNPEYCDEGSESWLSDPEVYCCRYSAYEKLSGKIKECFSHMDDEDLLYLLNALFPKTDVYIHAAEGNSVSDTWENHDIVYDTSNMTCYSNDSYTSYDCGANGKRSSKARFVLKAPEAKYVDALIDLSTEDGNTELTALLQELAQKLKDGLVVYEDDPLDEREIGKEYDIEDDVTGEEDDDYEEFDEGE